MMQKIKNSIFLTFLAIFVILSFYDGEASNEGEGNAGGWEAGVAHTVITPETPIWMAGYASRDHPSEGTLHNLWAKALALEDNSGRKAVLITSDLLGFPKGLSDRIRNRLEKKYDLSRDQVILNSSHTHTGPVLQDALYDIYPLDDEERQKIEQYSSELEDQIVTLVGEALASVEPAKLYSKNGVVRFQVNRRNNDSELLNRQTDLNGPNDYAVPVIKVEDEEGKLMAVAFGYACHPTTLSFYKWSGDYPGFAQLELEKSHPGATAIFFQGAGGDQNPLPRRSVGLARQYGRELAAAVDRVLDEKMRELPPRLSTAYSEVKLSLTGFPDEEVLSEMTEEASGYQKRWADRILGMIKDGEPLTRSYPYPVQVWKLGDQPIVSLGGEVVIDYTIRLKRIFGQDIFVLGYSNDVMSYIPSVRILREGGYEGITSQMVYGLPGTWEADIETRIIQEVLDLARQAGVDMPESELVGN
ncbi:MAG: neutral/alkaline non-lysosomal ceramidase N-terminal domain-containing protein [Bacteroidales bacterium]|nr:neutral/alkaline non-lysosomal ceramidase N-terminal domain-containing protein [Bacteroidales bacterium]